MRLWTGTIAAEFLPLIEDRWTWGSEIDELLAGDDTPLTTSVGHVLHLMGARRGLRLPDGDPELLAALERSYSPVARWTRWSLAELSGSRRLGLVAPHGVIETAGESLVLIEHREEQRYTRFWPVPTALYPAEAHETAREEPPR